MSGGVGGGPGEPARLPDRAGTCRPEPVRGSLALRQPICPGRRRRGSSCRGHLGCGFPKGRRGSDRLPPAPGSARHHRGDGVGAGGGAADDDAQDAPCSPASSPSRSTTPTSARAGGPRHPCGPASATARSSGTTTRHTETAATPSTSSPASVRTGPATPARKPCGGPTPPRCSAAMSPSRPSPRTAPTAPPSTAGRTCGS